MKIYTKKGDQGQTSLVDGSRLSKASPRIETYGTLDELNSQLGLLIHHMASQPSLDLQVVVLKQTQIHLFQLGSQLACENPDVAKKLPTISNNEVQNLEEQIDLMDKDLPPLRNFILPGGDIAAIHAHICRTLCRRCERLCVELNENSPLNYPAIPYLNRLSDYFYALARWINVKTKNADVEWIP